MELRTGLLGRSKEIAYLEQFYDRAESGLIVMYGRRGVGKSAILQEFCAGKDSCYYKARACSEREQTYLWGAQLRESGLESEEYPTYDSIMQQLTLRRSVKKIIVIDQFEHIMKNSTMCMDSLTRILHNQWNNQPVLIILCSAAIGWVENSMVLKLGTAAFEISGFLKIKELGFSELFTYFSEYTMRQCLETYAVLGGIFAYWEKMDQTHLLQENLCRLMLRSGEVLQLEAKWQVEEELRETSVYHTLLSAIAAGRNKLNELHAHTGFSRAKISVYLKNLMELELVEKVFSFDTAGKENTKKGIYRISSHLVHFYFRYLYPHLSQLERMEPQVFYEIYIGPTLTDYAGMYFPKVCSQYLEKLNREDRLPFTYTKSGEWVGKAGTIDFVAQDDAGHTLIAGCDDTMQKMSLADYEWLLFCARQARLKADVIYLFAMEGFDQELEDIAGKDEKVHLIEWRNLYI